MTSFSPGRLCRRLTLEAPLLSPDGGGGSALAWTAVADVWADVRPSGGGERFAADRLAGEVSHEIVLRWRPDVHPAMRFVAGARTFEIRAVLDAGERRRWLRCLVVERKL